MRFRARPVAEYGALTSRDQLACDVMSRNVITVTEDMSLTALLNHFETHGFRRMPVTKDGMIVGSVDRQDLLRALVVCSEKAADSNSDKNVQQNEFVDLFSANQTGMGAGPHSFCPASLSFPFFHW